VLITNGTGFIVDLEVDEKFLDVEPHSLTLVNWQKSTSPSLSMQSKFRPYFHNRNASLQAWNYRWRKRYVAIHSL